MTRFQYSASSATQSSGDLLAICVFEGDHGPTFKAADAILGKSLSKLSKSEGFRGAHGQSMLAEGGGLGFVRILLLGAGKRKSFTNTVVRDLSARAAKAARARNAAKLTIALPAVSDRQSEEAVYFAALGAKTGLYKFNKYKGNAKKEVVKTVSVALAADKKPTAKQSRSGKAAVARAEAVADGVCKARDFVNEPAGFMNPSQMVKEARAIAKRTGLGIKVLGRKECEKLGMGMYLAVGRGSAQEPKFIHMTYKPKKPAKKRIVLIGKGVMFDSGGYSIKPSASMLDMKIDMAGAAAVTAAMSVIGELGCPYEVHSITACCENMVDADAYRLGDVLEAMDGTTVEINNTDAEGRLTLGDAITYAREKIDPDEILDFATLTGACMVALGPYTGGVMTKNEGMAKRWLEAAEGAEEHMWRLPLNERLRGQLKSNIADMRNTGERWGGAITAGLFLSHFARDSNWLHVDLAGPASSNSEQPSIPRGGTGFAVATIVEYLTA